MVLVEPAPGAPMLPDGVEGAVGTKGTDGCVLGGKSSSSEVATLLLVLFYSFSKRSFLGETSLARYVALFRPCVDSLGLPRGVGTAGLDVCFWLGSGEGT